jgi:hypothetical protein
MHSMKGHERTCKLTVDKDRRGIIVYKGYQCFCPFVRIGFPPLPLHKRVCLLPWSHTPLRVRYCSGGTQFGRLERKDKDEFSMYSFGRDFIRFSLMRNYLLVVYFARLVVKLYCTELNVQIRFPLKESQGTYLLLCMTARGKADSQCRREEVYIVQPLLLAVQVGITLTTAMPRGLGGRGVGHR